MSHPLIRSGQWFQTTTGITQPVARLRAVKPCPPCPSVHLPIRAPALRPPPSAPRHPSPVTRPKDGPLGFFTVLFSEHHNFASNVHSASRSTRPPLADRILHKTLPTLGIVFLRRTSSSNGSFDGTPGIRESTSGRSVSSRLLLPFITQSKKTQCFNAKI